ncbi:hypothetical protein LTR56_025039 [Elasticomyces elasticus]|nr:hypothetical protein LTR56_025039 [Elasticomyces elasticus]KAK5741570.1 hypothetical protein LTS12_024559 [Elasticomyces elasticus]
MSASSGRWSNSNYFSAWEDWRCEEVLRYVDELQTDLPRNLQEKTGGPCHEALMELKPYIIERCSTIDNTRVEILLEALKAHAARLPAEYTVRLILTGGDSQRRTFHAALEAALRTKTWPSRVELSPMRESGSSDHYAADDIVRDMYRIACDPHLGYAVTAAKHYVIAHDTPDGPLELADGIVPMLYYTTLVAKGSSMAHSAVWDIELEPTDIDKPEFTLQLGTVLDGAEAQVQSSPRISYYDANQVRAIRNGRFHLPPLQPNGCATYSTCVRLERVNGLSWDFVVVGRRDGASDADLKDRDGPFDFEIHYKFDCSVHGKVQHWGPKALRSIRASLQHEALADDKVSVARVTVEPNVNNHPNPRYQLVLSRDVRGILELAIKSVSAQDADVYEVTEPPLGLDKSEINRSKELVKTTRDIETARSTARLPQ